MTEFVKPRLNSAFKRLMSVHWWMAGCYLILFIGGAIMARLPKDPLRNAMFDFHKSIGILTMALLTLRILTLIQVMWKKYTKKWPKFSSKWIRNFILHGLMYLLMWAVPTAGVLLSNSFRANNVRFFGITLPDIFPEDSSMISVGRSMHFWFGYTFLVLILLHAIVQWKVVKANWRRFKGWIGRKLINT